MQYRERSIIIQNDIDRGDRVDIAVRRSNGKECMYHTVRIDYERSNTGMYILGTM